MALVILNAPGAQSTFAYLRFQPGWHIAQRMGVGEAQRFLWALEGMSLSQLALQVLLVHLLDVTVLVHVQIERLLERKEFLIGQIWLGEIVLVDRFLKFCK